MTINLVEICRLKYPGQIEAGNINFRQPYIDILIGDWNVPNIARPLESDLLLEAATYQAAYDNSMLLSESTLYIASLLNTTAQSKKYDSALSCASYATSSNTAWKAEAIAFIAWRDAIMNYSINIQNEVLAGSIPLPTLAEFIAGLPVITWP